MTFGRAKFACTGLVVVLVSYGFMVVVVGQCMTAGRTFLRII